MFPVLGYRGYGGEGPVSRQNTPPTLVRADPALRPVDDMQDARRLSRCQGLQRWRVAGIVTPGSLSAWQHIEMRLWY